MKIRILGAGWYGCHLGRALLRDGHDVEIHEMRSRIFGGASGAIPARLHNGAHYPRSHRTREACQRHTAEFIAEYGHLTRGVPVNLYAIAENHSYVDFDQYVASLRGEFDFIVVHDPAEFGLQGVEGAILTGERHILADAARAYFEKELAGRIRLGVDAGVNRDADFDVTIDCTFCAQDAAGVDRYEPCLVLQLRGPVDRAVTIMDGPFSSLYPWDPARGLCSLSSAMWTPFSKTVKSYGEAQDLIDNLQTDEIWDRAQSMFDQMAGFYPDMRRFSIVRPMLSIRAMPLSGADTRLVEVRRDAPDLLRVRAGKIDAVLDAERMVKELIA